MHINKLSSKTLRRTAMRSSAVTLMALLGVACGASDDDGIDTAALTGSIPCEPTDAGTQDPDPDTGDAGEEGPAEPGSPLFASVTANGSGCPAGTWETVASADGETYTTRFKAYEAALEGESRISFKDCNLTVKLKAPDGLSYAVTDFSYYGHVKLAAGVRGFATANSYFQGNPVPSADKETRVDFTGPIDEPLVLHRNAKDAGLVWSPCGVERNLQIVTRVGVQKDSGVTGTGKLAVEALGNPEDLGLSFKLAWRKCSDNSAVDAPDLTPTKPTVDAGTVSPPNPSGADAGSSASAQADAGSSASAQADAGTASKKPRSRWPWGN